jgi:hypothetical protein
MFKEWDKDRWLNWIKERGEWSKIKWIEDIRESINNECRWFWNEQQYYGWRYRMIDYKRYINNNF